MIYFVPEPPDLAAYPREMKVLFLNKFKYEILKMEKYLFEPSFIYKTDFCHNLLWCEFFGGCYIMCNEKKFVFFSLCPEP